MAACDASCEEDEALNQRREEFDLMAAQRGRAAMLQEQRKRDRDAEERLAKRKRRQAKNVSVQADLETRQVVQENHEEAGEEFEEENDCTRVENFKNKPNLHRRNTAKVYNPQNFTSNSVDSSNSETESSPEVDSEVEFNQISNLLKQKSLNFCPEPKKVEQVVEVSELSDSSESDPPPRQAAQLKKQVKIKIEQAKKSILKKVPAKKIAQPLPKEDERVSYLDFGNKYVTSYVPGGDLITENTEKSGKNAKTAARKQEKRSEKDRRSVSDDVLR